MNKRIVLVLFVASSILILIACAPSVEDADHPPTLITLSQAPLVSTAVIPPTPPRATSTAALTPTQKLTATPTIAGFWETWMAARPRNMEYYGFIYDKKAAPELPPRESVHMPIWGQRLPLKAFSYTPRFIDTPSLSTQPDISQALTRAKCTQDSSSIQCSPESPLADFNCEYLLAPASDYPGLDRSMQVLAICLYSPLDENEDRSSYLYRTGCAFRRNAGLILDEDGQYRMIKSPDQVKEILLPIDSPEKALSYLQMNTGLSATFNFEADKMLLYFMDPIQGTHIEEIGGIYTINLFQYVSCLCEPWVDSQVVLTVDRTGEITWKSALPISMTIGFSCAD
ncbi:hypothetical protein FDZ73_23890 [bacterium]|nr:MAG: hypothetical protein FDZ73_23890 [bacterium]